MRQAVGGRPVHLPLLIGVGPLDPVIDVPLPQRPSGCVFDVCATQKIPTCGVSR
jgi:hypothetical protein